MEVPVYERRVSIPGSIPYARASGGALAAPAEALAYGGRVLERETDAHLEARRVNELTELTLQATKEFDELDAWVDRETEWDKIVPGYQQKVKELQAKHVQKIQDPQLRRLYANDFAKLSVRGLDRARTKARAREIDANKATLITSVDEYADLAARAETFTQAAERINFARSAIAGAVAAGTIDAAEGTRMDKTFTDASHINYIKREILEDPQRVNDDLKAGRYEGLDEAIKTDLLKYSQNMAEAYERDRVETQNRKRIEEERALRKFQDDRATALAIQAMRGQLTRSQLLTAATRREIDRQDLAAINSIVERSQGGEDDPGVRLELVDGILQGTVGRRDVLRAVGSGLSATSAEALLGKIAARDAKDDITQRPEYKDAETHVKTMLKTTGVLDKFDISEGPRIERALDEMERRVRAGEKVRDVRDDIVIRYRPQPATTREFPNPLYGSKDNLEESYRRTVWAYSAGEIDTPTYKREIENLWRLNEMRDRDRAAQPPAKKAGKNDLEKQLKERQNAW